MKGKYLPARPSKAHCLLLMGLVLCLYFLDNPSVAACLGSNLFTYVFKPALWLGLALFIWFLPRMRPKAKLRMRGFLNWWAFNFAVIFIATSVVAGFIDGLGKSPYSHSLIGITTNLIAVGSVVVGQELVRSYLVNSLTKEENYLTFILVALFMAFISIYFKKFLDLKDFEGTVKFVAQYFAPEFAKGLLVTYLAFLGGAVPAIIYMGLIQAFQWFSPILPDLQWITSALVGVLAPIFCLTVMQNMYAQEAKILRPKDKDTEGPVGWIVTSLISIGMIWFAVGVFPLYPSVIVTGSMEPMIMPGDVILVKKVTDIKDIHKGDVVQFKSENILISHRIIEIMKEEGITSYRTKGDNNSVADYEPVKPEQIKGKIIKVVPKIGWPTMLMKSKDDIPLSKVQF